MLIRLLCLGLKTLFHSLLSIRALEVTERSLSFQIIVIVFGSVPVSSQLRSLAVLLILSCHLVIMS